MTFVWGKTSKRRLLTCHPVMQDICNRALELSPFDLFILCGHRTEEEQTAALESGTTTLPWPKSKHNSNPSLAVDIAPYPVDWGNTLMFHALAGVMFSAAQLNDIKDKGFRLRWGGDWNGNWTNKDQNFHDLPHFELVKIS